MVSDLDQLAERLRQLADLAHALRLENQSLRQQIVDAQADARSLRARLDAARQRIEALIDKLPAVE